MPLVPPRRAAQWLMSALILAVVGLPSFGYADEMDTVRATIDASLPDLDRCPWQPMLDGLPRPLNVTTSQTTVAVENSSFSVRGAPARARFAAILGRCGAGSAVGALDAWRRARRETNIFAAAGAGFPPLWLFAVPSTGVVAGVQRAEFARQLRRYAEQGPVDQPSEPGEHPLIAYMAAVGPAGSTLGPRVRLSVQGRRALVDSDFTTRKQRRMGSRLTAAGTTVAGMGLLTQVVLLAAPVGGRLRDSRTIWSNAVTAFFWTVPSAILIPLGEQLRVRAHERRRISRQELTDRLVELHEAGEVEVLR